ncbi:DUF4402 domain-containing protein [Novosphingobium tardum]|uniref:DUF4402 domain-containing protein n=1 Tax=Novosphingobium tardum TaxID=1538021 RepID=A0ABV8RM12_9SPHN
MKKFVRLAVAGSAMIASMALATSANAAATATADAKAEILSTLTVAARSGSALDFGQIAVNGAGTAVVAASGARTCSATLVCVGTATPVVFDVSGTPGASIAVTLPTGTATLTGVSTAATMSLGSFTQYFPNGNTLVAGTTSFQVGGTLTVGATQAADVYNGTFQVSVEYN